MFDKLREMMSQFETLKHLMGDENMRALLAHPKVEALLKDDKLQEQVRRKDFPAILGHPKVAELFQDAELLEVLSKIDPSKLQAEIG